MQKTEWYFSDYQFHFNSELKDSILFYWKVAFNNKNNKRQPSLRKMYFFTMDKVNKQLEEPDDDIYDYFKRKLVDKKIW